MHYPDQDGMPHHGQPVPPHWANGWGRYIQSATRQAELEIRNIRAELDWRTHYIQDHEERIRNLEERQGATVQSASRLTILDGIKPHGWKIILAVGAVLGSRMATGAWPDPMLIVEKLFGLG